MRFVGYNATYPYIVTRPVFRTSLTQPLHSFSTFSRHLEQSQLLLDIDDFSPRIQPNPTAKNVAILGGGITGLATAYNVARTIPNAKITIYEQHERVGGWLNSEVINVLGGEVLFEWGPRTLRSDVKFTAKATIDLICCLGLETEVIGIPKHHKASMNRFMYYQNHLTRMPGPYPGAGLLSNFFQNLSALFREPIFAGLASSMIAEPTVKLRAPDVEDESVGDFLSRRFGRAIADNLASGLIHGIYAGDIYKLSMRSLFPFLWYMETRDLNGSGVLAEMLELYFRGEKIEKYESVRLSIMSEKANQLELNDKVKSTIRDMRVGLSTTSVFTFINGIGTLTQRLEKALKNFPNVRFRTKTRIESINFDATNQQFMIFASGKSSASYFDYVVSTLGPQTMQSVLHTSSTKRSPMTDKNLATAFQLLNQAVNVMVVNLYYSDSDLIPDSLAGFGYLIPRSVAIDENPERALGVIFGSESSGPRGADAIIPYTFIPWSAEDEDLKAMIEQNQGRQILESKEYERFLERNHAIRLKSQEIIDANEADLRASHARASHKKDDDHPIVVHESGIGTRRVGQDTAPGTKLTVMLGGHWWDGWAEEDLPSETEGIEMAKRLLGRHLGIQAPPLVAKARLQRNAIPQYRVGRRRAMSQIHETLKKEYNGRLKVAGPWWQTGVGVNDCISKARETALVIREQWDDHTGLEGYCNPEIWVSYDIKSKRSRKD